MSEPLYPLWAISGRAKVAGIIGWPVGHSLSPRLHTFWLQTYGIDGAYIPMAVAPQNIEVALNALPALGFRGANLTVPHKQAALGIVDHLDDTARRVGAVNTVTVDADGRLTGSATDGYGFLQNLREALPKWSAHAGPAVIIGAGGAARAVAFALLDAGAPALVLVNRTREHAATLADALRAAGAARVDIADWSARADCLGEASLLVNTTSLGMNGEPPLDLSLARLPADAVVNDIVYAPLETPLLSAARARGCRVVDGIGMLLHQARPSFATWFGVDPEVTPQLRRHVLGDQA